MTQDQLKAQRDAINLTQKEMAKALKTPLSTYRKWEQGERRVPGIVEVAILEVKRNQKAG